MYPVKSILSGLALSATLLAPVAASAAEGFATANVNMRSGPSTRYPAVVVIPVGTPVEIHGCLADANWCDVSFYRGRGWVSGTYVQAEYQSSRVYVAPRYYRPLGIPTVTFELGNYWDRNYRNRDFYRDRDRWRGGPDRYDRERDRFEPSRGGTRVERDRDRDRDRQQFDRDRNRDQDRERVERERERVERDRNRIERDRERDRAEDRDRNRPQVDRDNGSDRRTIDRREERNDNDRRNVERGRNSEGRDRRFGCIPDDPSCDIGR